jgi:hypothetical protein
MLHKCVLNVTRSIKARHPERSRQPEMEMLEEKTKDLAHASYQGDVAAVRALLESGDVDVAGIANEVHLRSALHPSACGFCAEMAGTSRSCECKMCSVC